MIASRTHWRLLIGTVLALMAVAWIAPRFLRPPELQENRSLSAAPKWSGRLADLGRFRKAADAYVADHFPARVFLIAGLNRARMVAGVSGSTRVIVGRDGWLFYDDDTHLCAARGDPPMAGGEVREWLKVLAGRTADLRAKGIPYFVLSPPVKETIYPKYGPSWYAGPSPSRPAIQLPRLASAAGIGEILYLNPQVAGATGADQPTYTRHDTHWTGFGAYAGYVGLMNRLHELGLAEAPRPPGTFRQVDLTRRGPRDLALMLGVSAFLDVHYPHLVAITGDHRADVTYLGPKQDWTAPQVIETGEAGKPVLLMTRDSFSNELLPFLYPHFSRIILAHNQDGFWRPDLVDRFKPDIVILEVIEPGLRVAMGEGPAPSADALGRIDLTLSGVGTGGHSSGTSLLPSLGPPDPAMATAIAQARPSGNCNIETATLKPGAAGQATFTASGWISDLGARLPRSEAIIALKGTSGLLALSIQADKPRPDVAAYFKTPSALNSGFVATAFVAKLPSGTYVPVVYRRGSAGWIACEAKSALVAP